ncbi:MAG TPA: Na+/H+ antiporter subunit E [Gemmatimonadales bacterium]|nr:Na+/H+ antiporter subunit E [Gemmatimonadales bacterium]
MAARKTFSGSLLLTALLIAGWYVLSGKFDLLHFGTGVVSAVVIVIIARPPADATLPRPLGLVRFLGWLAGQVLLSNLRVARLVLSPSLPIRPTMVRQSPVVRGGRALALLGISTTLTPGTLTVDISEDESLVHALDAKSAADTRADIMAGRVARVFGQEAG